MRKIIATFAALATLVVQLAIMSEMLSRENPPPLFIKASEYFSETYNLISETFSEQRISGREVVVPEGIFGKAIFAFHRSTSDAWKIWAFISFGVSIIVFVFIFVLDVGIDIDLIDIDDLMEILGASIGSLIFLMFVKCVWIIFRLGFHFTFG